MDPDNRFDKYILVRRLGKGSNGIVHLGWQIDLRRFVAVKILTATGDEDQARFLREARLSGALNHPNIVRVHKVGRFQGQYFIAMDYIDGVELDKMDIELMRAVQVIRDAARAVHFAHIRGIIHRDIKPGNLMLGDDGRVFVMDFGLARALHKGGTVSMTGAILGSPHFMSPEQANGAGHHDPRTDVYGLGASLFALVCGVPPYDGETAVDVIRKVLDEDPPRPRSLVRGMPRDVEIIIQKAMQKERGQRYFTALELAEDLDQALRGSRIQARPTTVWYRTHRRITRRPVVSTLAALLLASILGAGSTIAYLTISASHRQAGIEAGQRAGRAYATGNIEAATEQSLEAIRLAPDYAIGHFWLGRVRLNAYTRQRTLPAAYTIEGTLAFSLPPPETAEQTRLRLQAMEAFERMDAAGNEGLEGWEDSCRRGILHLFAGANWEAERELGAAWQTGLADGEVAFFQARAQYYQKKFHAGIDTLNQMRLKRGLFGREVEVARAQMIEARALKDAVRGVDPTPDLRAALDACRNHEQAWTPARIAGAGIQLEVARTAMGRGEGERSKRSLDALIASLTDIVDQEPDCHQALANAHALRARWFATHGNGKSAQSDFAAALTQFSRASALDPFFDGAWVRCAQTHRELAQLRADRGDTADSERHLEAAAENFEHVRAMLPDVEIERAQIAAQLRRARDPKATRDAWLKEVEALDAVCAKWPDHARAGLAAARTQVGLARWLHLRGEDPTAAFEAAIARLNAALRVNPDWVDAACARGTARINHALYVADHGEDPSALYHAAMADFTAALNINAEMAAAYVGRAGLLMNHGAYGAMQGDDPANMYSLAEADFRRALEIHPEFPGARLGWGNLCMNRAEWRGRNDGDPAPEIETARRHYSRALEVNPRSAEVLMRRGLANMLLSDPSSAHADLTAAVRLNPSYEGSLRPVIQRCEAALRSSPDF